MKSCSPGRGRGHEVVCAIWLYLVAIPLVAAPPAIELKVAAVQFRWVFDVAKNTEAIIGVLDRLAGEGVKVAVFPNVR
jgi:hypothetical protein